MACWSVLLRLVLDCADSELAEAVQHGGQDGTRPAFLDWFRRVSCSNGLTHHQFAAAITGAVDSLSALLVLHLSPFPFLLVLDSYYVYNSSIYGVSYIYLFQNRL